MREISPVELRLNYLEARTNHIERMLEQLVRMMEQKDGPRPSRVPTRTNPGQFRPELPGGKNVRH